MSIYKSASKVGFVLIAAMTLQACGGSILGSSAEERRAANRADVEQEFKIGSRRESSLLSLFNDNEDPNVTVAVNRYIWNASLEVLNFMPLEGADPFSGVMDFGYGTPPGGRRAYSATVLVKDPALDARSLVLTLRTRSGAVSLETQREIENAILTRARQLRIADSKL